MSNIYECATYILAVPDLHLTYLKRISIKNHETIEGSNQYREDIYHLIQGNTSKLAALEQAFLNDAQVPKDPPALRQLLVEYTDHFAPSFMTYQKHDDDYCPVRALDHICQISEHHRDHLKAWIVNSKNSIKDLHQCHETVCPLKMFLPSDHPYETWDDIREFKYSNWKARVLERSSSIRHSMEFLTDLLLDWSSRVWVISEFNIAKKKNNLKYWFTQLSFPYDDEDHLAHSYKYKEYADNAEVTFFKFDFHDDASSCFDDMIMNTPYYANQEEAIMTRAKTSNPIYIRFHYTMIRQLRQQTFLDMMLNSKASKNEDRFYSVLPLSEYHKSKSEVSHWNIYNMVSVKLKLYDIMNTKDKMALLFWSGDQNATNRGLLPTFATSTLPLAFQTGDFIHSLSDDTYCNFDWNDPSSLMLHHHRQHISKDELEEEDEEEEENSDSNRYYLRLKPKEYMVSKHDKFHETPIRFLMSSVPILKQLGMARASTLTLDIVSIPAFQRCDLDAYDPESFHPADDHRSHFLTLVGCFVTNTWIIPPESTRHYPEHKKGHRVRCYGAHGEANKSTAAAFFDIY
ncbi:hypothetical protein BCR42DRAFT_430127 [Absidia repens]|uniref:Uncharacterized protein n=1 Tax=Absidia repens TaxID=90262 RepID=A0A1X2HK98_9FUNG|nr:hypothetical protein BCR42DRAFT_430127 [Absidia repens]